MAIFLINQLVIWLRGCRSQCVCVFYKDHIYILCVTEIILTEH